MNLIARYSTGTGPPYIQDGRPRHQHYAFTPNATPRIPPPFSNQPHILPEALSSYPAQPTYTSYDHRPMPPSSSSYSSHSYHPDPLTREVHSLEPGVAQMRIGQPGRFDPPHRPPSLAPSVAQSRISFGTLGSHVNNAQLDTC